MEADLSGENEQFMSPQKRNKKMTTRKDYKVKYAAKQAQEWKSEIAAKKRNDGYLEIYNN